MSWGFSGGGSRNSNRATTNPPVVNGSANFGESECWDDEYDGSSQSGPTVSTFTLAQNEPSRFTQSHQENFSMGKSKQFPNCDTVSNGFDIDQRQSTTRPAYSQGRGTFIEQHDSSRDGNRTRERGFGGRRGFKNSTERRNDMPDKPRRPFQGDNDCMNEGGEPVYVVINGRDVGRIIGKGGSRIRELEENSQTKLKIINDDDGGETKVRIQGTKEQQEKAQELIDEIINPTYRRPSYQNRSSYNDRSSFQDESSKTSYNDRSSYQDESSKPSYNDRSSFQNESSKKSDNFTFFTSEPTQAAPERKGFSWGNLAELKRINDERKFKDLAPIKKDFYFEDPEVANMYDEDVAYFRKQNNNISCNNMHEDGRTYVPNPVRTFEQAFSHFPEILEQIELQGFEKPSPIQTQAWPVLLQGLDLIGIAQTGTGKTLAFLLPALIHIDNQPVPREERCGPTVLVLSPTRELALQIETEVKKINYKGIKCVCVYGGGDRRKQVAVVTKGVEIIVATPGRLNDLISNEIVDVRSVTYLVLDEADRMLDMGFEPQIKKVLLDIRPDRQTVMTSATWPPDVRRLGESYLKNPIQVFVGSLDLAAVHTVTQRVEILADEDKRPRIMEFLQNEMGPEDKLLIFVGKKVFADDLSSDFSLQGINCQCIHGDREQYDREQALEDFKESYTRILIATDVASRGLDVKDITHVINYDFPRNMEEYVHRVGRTGRAGRSGQAISFMTRGDWRSAKALIDILVEANQHVPDELADMAERYTAYQKRMESEGGRGFGGRRGGRGGRGGRGRRDRPNDGFF